jgi:hypothetical protein
VRWGAFVVESTKALWDWWKASGADAKPPVLKDAATDARDKWIYEQCWKGVPYKKITAELAKKRESKPSQDWRIIKSEQGIRDAAKRYAERKELPAPPRRQDQ